MRLVALLLLALLLIVGCTSEPAQDPKAIQNETNKIAQLLTEFYKGTSREGLITKVAYNGKVVTVYTEIFPDKEGVETVKNMRVGIYTFLKPQVNVEKVEVVDKGGNKWVYP